MQFHKQYDSVPLYKMQSISLVDCSNSFALNDWMTIEQIRRAKLEALIEQCGSVTAVASKLGHSTSAQVSQWRNAAADSRTGKPRTISTASARLIESKFGKPHGWMDVESNDPPAPGTAMSIQSIMDSLDSQLENIGHDTRKSIGGLLAVYIEDPRHGEQISNAIETIIKNATEKKTE